MVQQKDTSNHHLNMSNCLRTWACLTSEFSSKNFSTASFSQKNWF